MAQPFDFEQPAIGRKADLAQLRQVVQALADAEVVAVVDGRLGTQGPIFLVILLDPRVLVIDVQGRGDVLGDDAGAQIRCRRKGSAQLKMPLSSASKAMPFRASCRLAYSWPFRHSLALNGK